MPYKGLYKDLSEDIKERLRARWRRYYYRNRDTLKGKSLRRYHRYVSTAEGHKKIRKINRRAETNRRFGVKDRNVILSKFNHKCYFCGKSGKLYIHHLDGNGRGKDSPNNSLDNLVACCPTCHANIHFWGSKLV